MDSLAQLGPPVRKHSYGLCLIPVAEHVAGNRSVDVIEFVIADGAPDAVVVQLQASFGHRPSVTAIDQSDRLDTSLETVRRHQCSPSLIEQKMNIVFANNARHFPEVLYVVGNLYL